MRTSISVVLIQRRATMMAAREVWANLSPAPHGHTVLTLAWAEDPAEFVSRWFDPTCLDEMSLEDFTKWFIAPCVSTLLVPLPPRAIQPQQAAA